MKPSTIYIKITWDHVDLKSNNWKWTWWK